jgi:hypothetical protein
MPDGLSVDQFFLEAEKTMRLKFRGWEKDLPHEGEKGGIRERRVADFLSATLPQTYGIGTGHIISPKEPFVSYQTDIVIYDAQEGIALPADDYYSLFPCECVYAAVEVKSKLEAHNGKNREKTSIYQCLESTTRLKALERDNLPSIHSIVFAYEVSWKQDQATHVIRWFDQLGGKYSLTLPDMVFVLDPGFVLTKPPTLEGYDEEGGLVREYPNDSLLFFVANLLYRLSRMDANLPRLWLDYKRWLPGGLMCRHHKIQRRSDEENREM